MIAFHGKAEVKEMYLGRVREHRAADQLWQKFGYWQKDGTGEFRGCAVGCTLHSDNHGAYETELGIQRILARLEDGIFEALPADRAMAWPEEFLAAIEPGADLSMVWPQFAIWMLVDVEWGVIRFAKSERTRTAIEQVAKLYQRQVDGDSPSASEFRSAADAADAAAAVAAYAADAAYAAYAAVADAADAAAYAAVADAADADAAAAAAAAYAYAAYADAADADADAAYAAYAAADAADAAYAAADAAYAAYAAADAAAAAADAYAAYADAADADAAYAAYAAADAADAAYAAADAADAAYAAAKFRLRVAQAEKLLALLRAAQVKAVTV